MSLLLLVISFLTIATFFIPHQLPLALLSIHHGHLPWALWNPSSWNTLTWKRFWENHFSLTSKTFLKWTSSPPPVLRPPKTCEKEDSPLSHLLFPNVPSAFFFFFSDSQPLSSTSKHSFSLLGILLVQKPGQGQSVPLSQSVLVLLSFFWEFLAAHLKKKLQHLKQHLKEYVCITEQSPLQCQSISTLYRSILW